MFKQRLITALILAPIMIGGIFFLPLPQFMLFIGVITAVGAGEWANLSGVTSWAGRAAYVAMTGLAIFGLSHLDAHQSRWILMLAFAWWLAAFALVSGYPKSAAVWGKPLPRLLLGQIILLPMWIGFVQIKSYPLSNYLILYVLFIVWGADVGAYFAGRKFGKNKLAPNVSPGKTWEGVYGGMATTALVALIGGYCLQRYTVLEMGAEQWLALMALTAVVTMVSVLGDLVESMVKRHRGIKDSSNLLPGHGGVMDRIDSMTAALPVFALALGMLGWKFDL